MSSPRVPTVLVTGFEPFGGQPVNVSWQAAQALHGRMLGEHRVVAARLPTEFGRSIAVLEDALERHRPDLVVALGQAGGRAALSLERVAINVDDARIADNAGLQPIDTPVVAGGPAAYFSSLPIKAIRAALAQAQLPAEVSQSAGTFVCNHLFYGLMHALATRPGLARARGGFIHLPWLPGQGEPFLPLESAVHGLELAIVCALATVTDIRQSAGALD